MFFSYSICYLRPSFLSLLVVTQIRGHKTGPFPPSPLRFVPCIFIAGRFQIFLPSSTRVELFLPTLHALSSWSVLYFFGNKFKISPRRDSNSRTNTIRMWLPLVDVIVVLTLSHRYNAVRGHRTGSNNSGAEDYLRRKTNTKQKIIHTVTKTDRIPQTK